MLTIEENWVWDKGELSVLSSQLFCNSKTILKLKAYLKNILWALL